jgi:hypothetical protein
MEIHLISPQYEPADTFSAMGLETLSVYVRASTHELAALLDDKVAKTVCYAAKRFCGGRHTVCKHALSREDLAAASPDLLGCLGEVIVEAANRYGMASIANVWKDIAKKPSRAAPECPLVVYTSAERDLGPCASRWSARLEASNKYAPGVLSLLAEVDRVEGALKRALLALDNPSEAAEVVHRQLIIDSAASFKEAVLFPLEGAAEGDFGFLPLVHMAVGEFELCASSLRYDPRAMADLDLRRLVVAAQAVLAPAH